MKTTDGGVNWVSLNVPDPFLDFKDMSILNEDTMWLVHNDETTGGIFRTTNGGENWSGINLQFSGGNPNKIYFYNRNLGFASSYGDVLYRTTNSGVNWNVISGTDGFIDIKFTDSVTGWKARGIIKKTTDGGLTWMQQTIPAGGIMTGSSINKITVLNKDTIWAIGGSVQYPNLQSRGIIFRTTNGGTNWLFQIPDTSIHVGGSYSYIQFTNKNNGWAYTLGLLGGIHTISGGDPIWYTDINQLSNEIPVHFKLYQNYPNPFNPATTIKFDIKSLSNVKIIVYDITGRQIEILADKQYKPGNYDVNFAADKLSSGVYFYTMIINNGKEVYKETKKMILIK